MNKPTNERNSLYLAALLHDNGKFWYRRGGKGTRNKHWVLSEAVVKEFFDDDLINDLVMNHHEEALKESGLSGRRKLLAEIVCDADTIASRTEREGEDDRSRRPLTCIFNKIMGHDGDFVQPISSLNIGQYEMPESPESYKYNELKQDYVEKWDAFLEELKSEASGNCDLTTLYFLYKKYLWCIPSAYDKTVPDISLFEHSRLTAAIALCLYDYFEKEKKGTLDFKVKTHEEERFLLIAADLNGIQDFIYNIGHDNALKALKGRSFYLQMLMEGVAGKILSEFELPESNLLFCGGGTFYLIIPNLSGAQDCVDAIGKKVNQSLLTEHFGKITLTFASLALSRNDLVKHINTKWTDLNTLLGRNKARKFASTIQPDFFEQLPFPFGGVMTCHATGIEICRTEDFGNVKNNGQILYNQLEFKKYSPPSGNKIYQIHDEEQGYKDAFVSESQFESIILGHRLKKKEVVSFQATNGEFKLPASGTFNLLTRPEAQASNLTKALIFNTDEFWEISAKSRGWKFYGGNWNPVMDASETGSKSAEFDHLRKNAMGLPYLAVLRMDMDNLGEIIRTGLEKPAFSRIVQLSNLLDYFFSGYLNVLKHLHWDVIDGINSDRKGDPLSESIQIIYLGGDDLSIVGKWNVMPDVAVWINDRFHEFTAKNPKLTLSAGIALFGAKYPLFKVSEEAGEAIDNAKNYRRTAKGSGACIQKNAVSFLGNCMSWEDFMAVKALKNQFYGWLKGRGNGEGKLPRAFVQLIQDLFFEFSGGKTVDELTHEDIQQRQYGRWRWHAAYLISRMGKRSHLDKELQELAAKLFTNNSTEKDYLPLLYTAAQWADFLTRQQPDHDNS